MKIVKIILIMILTAPAVIFFSVHLESLNAKQTVLLFVTMVSYFCIISIINKYSNLFKISSDETIRRVQKHD